MKNLINAFRLVAMLVVFTSCGDNLTNATYTIQDEDGDVHAIRCYDNGKVIFTKIEGRNVDVNNHPILYMCFGEHNKTAIKEFQRDGKTIKLAENGIIKDAFTFENNTIIWHEGEYKPDTRFSTIQNSGKYGGTVYEAKYDRETIYLVFIDDTNVFQIDGKHKILCSYEIEEGKLFIDNVNMILEEGKDKLIYNQSYQSLIFKKKDIKLDDLIFQKEFGNRRISTYNK